MPLEISEIIEITDPIYTFNEVVSHIDLRKYFAEKGSRKGRPRCDAYKMLKLITYEVKFTLRIYPEKVHISDTCKQNKPVIK